MGAIAEANSGTQPDAHGLPLDLIVDDVLRDPEILLLVGPRTRRGNEPSPANKLPLASPQAPAANESQPKAASPAKRAKRARQRANKKARLAAANRTSPPAHQGGKTVHQSCSSRASCSIVGTLLT